MLRQSISEVYIFFFDITYSMNTTVTMIQNCVPHNKVSTNCSRAFNRISSMLKSTCLVYNQYKKNTNYYKLVTVICMKIS